MSLISHDRLLTSKLEGLARIINDSWRKVLSEVCSREGGLVILNAVFLFWYFVLADRALVHIE